MGFNIRAYGILIHDGKILIAEERRNGLTFKKFPGGGLEFGEGLADCLRRECLEEFGKEIRIISHFYTTDFFQVSAFNSKEQLISIYYTIAFKDEGDDLMSLKSTEEDIALHWLPLHALNPAEFMFPVDKKVVGILKSSRDQLLN